MTSRYSIVEIEWVDSVSGKGWMGVDQQKDWMESECVCWSSGYLIDSSNGYYTISPAVHGDRISDPFSIPKCSVRRVVYVRKRKR